MRKDLPSNTFDESNTDPCPTCKALGYEKWSHEEPCAACGGDGRVLGTTCLSCEGRGTIEVDSHAVCNVCDGTGKIRQEQRD